jgi:tetratricopeptide (TPR) repeat protein
LNERVLSCFLKNSSSLERSMSGISARWLLLIFPSLLAVPVCAQQPPPARMEETSARATSAPAPAIAKMPHKVLFGTLPVATRSNDAKKLLETAVDQYENVLLDDAISTAKQATAKDPHFALAFAVWSYAASHAQPNPQALQRAKALAPSATPDERLLIDWMVDVEQGDLLPAIGAMNDLLARFPNDKHIVYLTAEWLYFQQDYDRAREMLSKVTQIDPNFPPALNMLGYAYVETGIPDPQKAIACLKRYAAVQPNQPNPQDSLGEVSRLVGDDPGSLEHFSAALRIISTFFSSQVGLGDTYTLMGNYVRARTEYDKAREIAANLRDRFHADFQKASVYFWEGQPEQGRKALDTLLIEARNQKEPYAQYEVGFARAALSGDLATEISKLQDLETVFQNPVPGMGEPDRAMSLSIILREEVRAASLSGRSDVQQESIAKLERAAATSRNLIIEDSYDSARGYFLLAQGDAANAADELAGDPHSPLAIQALAVAADKTGDSSTADIARTRLKVFRAPTVEWYLVTHPSQCDGCSPTRTAGTGRTR